MEGREVIMKPAIAALAIAFCFARPAAADVIFSTDFNAGAPPQFSGVTTTEPVQSLPSPFSGLLLRNASGGNPASKTTLTLTGIGAHTFISLDFLFAALDSWDGTSGGFSPDFFNVAVNGTTIYSRTFDNFVPSDQSHGNVGQLTYGTNRFNAGGPVWPDAAYNMGAVAAFQNIAHTSSTLTVDWWASGGGYTGGTDESWAIDNLSVSANVIPEPQTYALLLAGLGLLGFAAHRRRA